MQTNAWIEPVKASIGMKAGGCSRNPDIDSYGTENPSLISQGGILAGCDGQQSGGIE